MLAFSFSLSSEFWFYFGFIFDILYVNVVRLMTTLIKSVKVKKQSLQRIFCCSTIQRNRLHFSSQYIEFNTLVKQQQRGMQIRMQMHTLPLRARKSLTNWYVVLITRAT